MTLIAISYIPNEGTLQEIYENGRWTYSVFRVPLNQLRVQAPSWYEKFQAQGKSDVLILVAHADSNGNLPLTTREAVEKHKPDLMYCCHPKSARLNNPHLPIQGWHDKEVLYMRSKEEGVIQIQEK